MKATKNNNDAMSISRLMLVLLFAVFGLVGDWTSRAPMLSIYGLLTSPEHKF